MAVPRVCLAALLLMGALALPAPGTSGTAETPVDPASAGVSFSEDERLRILAQGPWPPQAPPDPSNRFSGLPAAVELGRRLFFDPRLSSNGKVACASCHDPAQGFSDGRARALGLALADRNSQGLLDVAFQRWFGWDGGADSLWAASLRPMLAAHEMGSDATRVARVLRQDPALAQALSDIRRARPAPAPLAPASSDEHDLVDAGKAIGAFLETLVSSRTPFDEFRDALARGDQRAAARYPLPAQRGLKLFIGRGNCVVCHFGPLFSNGEFHDVGRPFMPSPGRVDPGRHAGIARVRQDRYNLLGPFNDQRPASGSHDLPESHLVSLKTRTVSPQHRNYGEWRTPSLRGLNATGPYMHDGSLASLEAVVRHYDELNEDRLHADGEALLRPLRLTDRERADLLAFLRSLNP